MVRPTLRRELFLTLMLIASAVINVLLAFQCHTLAERVVREQESHLQTLNDWDASVEALRGDLKARQKP